MNHIFKGLAVTLGIGLTLGAQAPEPAKASATASKATAAKATAAKATADKATADKATADKATATKATPASATPASAAPASAAKAKLKPAAKADPKLGYALGLEAAARLKKLGIEVDLAAYTKAVEDSLRGRKTRMSPEEASKLVKDLEAEAGKQLAERNRVEGAKFLVENSRKPGVVTTASGLQYQILRAGSGDKPTADDTVKVHYRGSLLDGSEFDSSYKRNEPASFPVKGVIRGWTEGLQLMQVGTKAKFFIPFELAYGERGRMPVIPPAALLVFEVELLGIQKAPAR